MQLTDQELAIVRKLHAGQHPDADYDPYPEFPDMFTQDVEQMPLSAAPEPKRRFIPSKWEHQRVMKIVRAIRKGLIVPGSQAKRELDEQRALLKPRFYNMWSDEVDRERDDAATKHIPAPKMKLPEHAESYNPPEEYLPTAEEVAAYQDLDAEDRPRNYLPQKYPNLRSVPSYARFINERFARCLDLYLCPRAMKKRVVDPETLLPDLPDPKELEPFPKQLTVEYRGHAGLVRSLSVDPSGQWLATGSDDKTARVWEVSTGRCVVMWAFKEAVVSVVWNPSKDLALLAVVRYDGDGLRACGSLCQYFLFLYSCFSYAASRHIPRLLCSQFSPAARP